MKKLIFKEEFRNSAAYADQNQFQREDLRYFIENSEYLPEEIEYIIFDGCYEMSEKDIFDITMLKNLKRIDFNYCGNLKLVRKSLHLQQYQTA